jgi:hypothetical protein
MSGFQRFWRFLGEWMPALAWSRSISGRILRIFLFLYIIGKAVLGWFGITIPSTFIIQMSLTPALSSGQPQPWFQRDMSVEFVIVALMVMILLAGTVAVAWFKTSGPKLVVDHRLEEDTFVRVYRLLVHVEGYGTLKPHAFIDTLLEDDLSPLQLPGGEAGIELQWSNYPPGPGPEMTHDTPKQSVGIVTAPEPYTLIIHGNVHQPQISTVRNEQPRKIYLRVKVIVSVPRQSIVRWFSFVPDSISPMFHRAVPEEPSKTTKL